MSCYNFRLFNREACEANIKRNVQQSEIRKLPLWMRRDIFSPFQKGYSYSRPQQEWLSSESNVVAAWWDLIFFFCPFRDFGLTVWHLHVGWITVAWLFFRSHILALPSVLCPYSQLVYGCLTKEMCEGWPQPEVITEYCHLDFAPLSKWIFHNLIHRDVQSSIRAFGRCECSLSRPVTFLWSGLSGAHDLNR